MNITSKSCHVNTSLTCLNEKLEWLLLTQPDKEALICGQVTFSYQQVIRTALDISEQFAEAGLDKGHRLALDAPRSSELYSIIIACLLSGISFIYVPRSLEPESKIKFARDTSCAAIFSLTSEFDLLDQVSMGAGLLSIFPERTIPRNPHSRSGTEIYCVRTSGTTGEPKIVPIYARQLTSFLKNVDIEFDIPVKRRWLWLHDLSFDLSIWEIMGCLFYGGGLVILSEEEKREPSSIWRVLEENHVNQIMVTPSEFRFIFSEVRPQDVTKLSLEEILFCGEKLSVETVRPFFSEFNGQQVKLVNTYGPSEATIFCSAHTVTEQDILNGSIPIGKAFHDMIFSLGSQENEHVGELLLQGGQVFEGYEGRPLENNIYKTGDICSVGYDDVFHYIKRTGGFVKVNGFRIDLLEIEEYLQSIPGVGEAVVLVENKSEDLSILCACINVMFDSLLTTRDLRTFCAKLSPWLRPARYLMIPQNDWPMNIRGKTNKAELEKRLYEQ
ncbi:AMP-binding protein [Photobacterium halotolerans]|uniref:AMP-binding protein n=1 Tax=Photobacterium halotolerans TaxID=265726 RepID=UPI0004093B16|nr:AMP-binding protein [Photobacterium halotolerans]